jgi:hypothetical protein
LIILTILFILSISAFAQMSTGQGVGMIGGGWGWGMNSRWFFFNIIIGILVILAVVYMMKRRL